MTTSSTTSKKMTRVTFFALVVMMFLSTNVFGQDNKNKVTLVEPETIEVSDEVLAASTTEFAVWFTGSNKATQTKKSSLSFGRKQLINSGITTNKVLIKTVLKKIVSQENGVA